MDINKRVKNIALRFDGKPDLEYNKEKTIKQEEVF